MSDRKSARTSLSLFLSTALHGAVIALIALGPTFLPGLAGKGDRNSSNVEFTVGDVGSPAVEAPVAQAKVEVKEIPQPVAPPVIKKSKPKKVVAQKLPEKAPEQVVQAEPVIAEEVAATEVVEESPVETLAAPAEEVTPVAEEPVAEEQIAAEPVAENVVPEEPVAPVAAAPVAETAAAAAPVAAAAEGTPAATQKGTGNDDALGQGAGVSAAQATQNYTGLQQVAGNKPPTYTREMRIKKLQGRGQLIYYVNKDGSIGGIALSKTTGSAQLDQAAIDAFKKYKFVPGQAGYTKHDFEFSLSGPENNDTGRLRTTMNQ